MNPTSRKSMGIALGLAAAMLLLAGGLLWWANTVCVRAEAELRNAKQTLNASRDRYRQTVNEEQLIRDTIRRFEGLDAAGIIGAERRLDWADELRSIRARLRLPALDFELAPQRTLARLGNGDNNSSFVLAASQMQLRASLLHEGDFFDLMAALRAPASALVIPRRCVLTPSGDRSTPQVNLRAECTLDWLTLTPPATPGDKP